MKLCESVVETDRDKLRVVSEEVDLNNKALVTQLYNVMMDAFVRLGGKVQGIAAIQLGYRKRVALLRYIRGTPPEVIYNPTVVFTLGRKWSNEGCLSEGTARYMIRRPLLAYVKYYTRDNELRRSLLTYKKARIFMHEYNHMDGILLQDAGRKVED